MLDFPISGDSVYLEWHPSTEWDVVANVKYSRWRNGEWDESEWVELWAPECGTVYLRRGDHAERLYDRPGGIEVLAHR